MYCHIDGLLNLFYPFIAYHHDASIEGVFPAWYPLECPDSRQQSAGNVSGMAHLLHRDLQHFAVCPAIGGTSNAANPFHPTPQHPQTFLDGPSTRIGEGRWPTPM